MRNLLTKLSINDDIKLIKLRSDFIAVITITKNWKFSVKIRYINVHYYYAKEAHILREIKLIHVINA